MSFTGSPETGPSRDGGVRSPPDPAASRARRQVAAGGPARRAAGSRHPDDRAEHHAEHRADLRRRLTRGRRFLDPGAGRGRAGGRVQERPGRAVVRGRRHGAADQRQAGEARARLSGERPLRGCSRRGRRWQARRRRVRPRVLRRADDLRRGAARDADRPGGDLRAGAVGVELGRRGGGAVDRQRHPVRAGGFGVDARRRQGGAVWRGGSRPGRCRSTRCGRAG